MKKHFLFFTLCFLFAFSQISLGQATVFTSTHILSFGNVTVGTYSAEQSYTVSGANLSGNLIISPTISYLEISLTSGSGFSASPITLNQSGGTVVATTVYVRFSTPTTGLKFPFINNASIGATTQIIDCSGTGVAVGATVTPGGPDNVCQSATPAAITLNGASVGGSATTGAWSITSGGGVLSSTAQTASPEAVTYTPAANFTGTVTLTLTTNGSPVASGTRTITVNPLPSLILASSTEACLGSSIVYSLPSGMSNYAWTVSSGGTITAGGGSGDNSVTVTWNTTVIQSVSVNYTNGNGCTATNSRTVPVKPLPTCSITGPDGPLTPSSSANIYTAPGGKSYNWSVTGNATIAGSTTSQTVSVTVGASCGVSFTVNLEITDLPGPVISCSSICSKVVTVTNNTISAIIGTASICVGSTTQLSDATSGGTWTSDSPGIATVSAGGLVSAVSAGTTLINYTVTNSCGTVSTSLLITVNPLPSIAAISGTATVCVGSTTQLSDATGFGSWSSASMGVATISAGGPGGPGGLVTGVSAGTSLITYTVNNGSCTNSVSQLVTVTSIPTITGTTPASRCGNGTVTLGATASAGTINWFDDITGGNLVGTGTSFTTPVISFPVTYYVESTDACGTTAARTAVVATVNALPIVIAPASLNVGSTITLSPTTGGTWVSSNLLIATVTDAGLVTGISAGTATFTFTDATTGCSATTLSVSVDPICIFLCNSDFEISTPQPATFNWIPQANVPCWKTTGSYGEIEIWKSGFQGVPAYTGIQFAELNARQVGTFYQTFTAVSGTNVMISFAHRGRYAGLDKMEVSIGPVGGSFVTIGTYYDNNSGWSYYSVPYTFPGSGSYEIRFVSIYSNGGGINNVLDGGNFLDAISIECPSLGGSTLTPGGPDDVCQSSTPTAITLNGASVGGSATTAAWSITSGGGILSTTAQTASPATVTYTTASNFTGTVILKLTSNGSPALSATRTITVNTLPTVASITGTTTVCVGSTTQLTDATSGGSWTSSNTGVATISAAGMLTAGGLVTGVSPGTSLITYSYTNGNNCTNSVTQSVTVNAVPTITSTTPGSVCGTGIVTLGATASAGVINWFDAITGGNLVGTGTSFNTPVLLSSATYYVETTENGCTMASRTAVVATVNEKPDFPIVGTIIQPTCSTATGSVILSGLPVGNWTINPGAITGSTVSTTISGLTVGTYNYTVTNSAGCITGSSADVVINALPSTPSTPIVGTITQPTCLVATGSVTLSGLPTGNWTINPGNITGSTTSTTISGLTAGTYNYSVTNSTGCLSAFTTDVVISAQPLTPTVQIITITQPTCAVGTGSITVPVQNGTDTYSFDNGNTFQTSNIKSGLVAGNYNVIIKSIGGCISIVTSATINALPTTPSTPIVGTITQPTCLVATGSVTLSGLPTGTWTINPGNITGSMTSTTIYDLTAGPYNYSVTSSTGCVSAYTSDVVISAQPLTPAVPIISVTQPTCAVGTGSITVTVQNGTDAYSFDNGNTFQTSNIKSGLVAGNYNVIIKSIGGCISIVTSATINALPTTPATPIVGTITQPTCTLATGSVTLSGLPAGNWTINPGNITGSTTSKTISDLTAGTYNFSANNSTGCVSAFTTDVVISAQPLTPTVPIITITQPTCAVGTGSITVTVQIGTDTYSFDNGNTFQTSNIKSGLVAGNYNVIIKSNGGCYSVVTSATINALPTTPATPVVGTITQPTCLLATGSVTLSGLPTGNWTINPGNITGSTTSKTISDLTAGTYNFSATNTTGCVSAFTTDVVISAQPLTSTVPIISVTQPTCAVGTGSITVTVQNGTDAYSFDNGNTFQTSNIKSGLVDGNYNVIIKSIGGCYSVVTTATINALPTTPATPVVGTITQPTCLLATGSVTLSGLPAGNWTINPGNITGSTTSKTISGLTAGTYNYSVSNSIGCVSLNSADVVINALQTIPVAPTVTLIQPTCNLSTGTITITAPTGTGITYSIGGAYQSGEIFSQEMTGTYNISAKNADGCISPISTFTLVAPDCNNIDLVVVETVNATQVIIGQTVVFTIVATNNGPDNATGTSVLVKLPSGFTFNSTTTSVGTYDATSGVWIIGNLNNGETETLTIAAIVNSSGSYVLTSVIQCNEVEVTLVNNTSTAQLLPYEFIFPDAFSPNNDGYNDKFVIIHNNSLRINFEVYNRWGNSVYKNEDYQNDWDGKGTANFLGRDLPDGTYYCTYQAINISTGDIVLNGVKYITLRR